MKVFDLRAGAAESGIAGGFFPRPVEDTYLNLLQALDAAKKDKKTKGYFIRLAPGRFSFSRALEVGQKLAALPKKQPVVCHSHSIDNALALIAVPGCDQLWLTESGEVSTVGIAAELSYVKGTLDKVGIVADMLAMGRYKSGAESLTRTEPSEYSLANLQELLGDLRQVWLGALSEKSSANRVSVEDGPYSPPAAEKVGLVTDLGFPDEALDAAVDAAGLKKRREELSADEWKEKLLRLEFGGGMRAGSGSPFADLIQLFASNSKREKRYDRVVVLPALGSITMNSDSPFGSDSGITATSMVRSLKRLRSDDSVKAIVIAMDSPGGSPLASDLIWRQVMLTRAVKPVVVSVNSMAASGGYYIASGADKIVASPAAIVGSIGVFGGKIVLGGALEKVGVTHFPVPANPDPSKGDRALYLSMNRVWDDASRAKVRATMQHIYDLFISRVAEGRGMDPDQVRTHAEGEVFLSERGKAYGLIDEIGGLERAIEVTLKFAKLDKDTSVELDGGADSVLETLLLDPQASEAEVKAAIVRYQQTLAASQRSLGEAALIEQLRPFAATLAPMIAGEPVVAALPWSIDLH